MPVRELWSVDELVGAALDELDDAETTVSVPPRPAAGRGRRGAGTKDPREPARERAQARCQRVRAFASLRRRSGPTPS